MTIQMEGGSACRHAARGFRQGKKKGKNIEKKGRYPSKRESRRKGEGNVTFPKKKERLEDERKTKKRKV